MIRLDQDSLLTIVCSDSADDGSRFDYDGEDAVWRLFRFVRANVDVSSGGHETTDANDRCGGDFGSRGSSGSGGKQ
jgi:hypothetical protein